MFEMTPAEQNKSTVVNCCHDQQHLARHNEVYGQNLKNRLKNTANKETIGKKGNFV